MSSLLPCDGGSTFVQNVGIHLSHNTVSYHRGSQYKYLDGFKHFFTALFKPAGCQACSQCYLLVCNIKATNFVVNTVAQKHLQRVLK
jgi:hypothetical protein